MIRGRRGLHRYVPHVPTPVDWPNLLTEAEQNPGPQRPIRHGKPYSAGSMVTDLQTSAEWLDLELLLQALRDLGAHPLLLSMPIAGSFYDSWGISQQTRHDLYYEPLRRLSARYGFPIVDFENEDEDRGFLDGVSSHLSRKGWVYYAQALDRFYHDDLH
jgi:poly-D-alanine transfer protein DltD